jgi:hypothetical protein
MGVILYELLCNLRPWQEARKDAEEDDRILSNLKSRPPTPSSKSKQVDKRLQGIALRCIDPEPSLRYANAQQLKESLEAWTRGEPDPHLAPWLIRNWHESVIRPLRRKPIRVMAALMLLSFLGILSYGIWHRLAYVWPHYVYFANASNFNSIPTGIYPLTSADIRWRSSHYRFTKKGWYGPTVQVDLHNHAGIHAAKRLKSSELKSDEEQTEEYLLNNEVQWKLEPDGTGKHLETTAFDRRGKTVWRLRFKDFPYSADYLPEPPLGRARPTPARLAKTTATQVQFDWSPEGYCIGARYFDPNGNPAPDSDGVYGWKGEVNRYGQPTKETYLGPDHQTPLKCKRGYEVALATYDGEGNQTSMQLYDRDMHPQVCLEGWATRKWTYDAFGNAKTLRSFDKTGQPVVTSEGYHGWDAQYDERGNLAEVSFLNVDGFLKPCKEGYAKRSSSFNKLGLVTSERYFDVAGQPTFDLSGSHGFTASYDPSGNRIEETWLGIDGKPSTSMGYATVRKTYSLSGLLQTVRFFDPAGESAISPDGDHGINYQYNQRGDLTVVTSVGVDGKVCNNKQGYAEEVSEYNDLGKIKSVLYFDATGNRTLARTGYHGLLTEYNDRGLPVSTGYIGVNEKPCNIKDGYSKIVMTYDQQANLKSTHYFDQLGQPVTDTDGCHGWTADYDDRGNQTQKAFADITGKACIVKEGFAKIEKRYNELGFVVEQRHFDVSGDPTIPKDGSHGWTAEYDEKGNVVTKSFIGVDDALCNNQGFAKIVWKYNELGKPISVLFFDASGNPTITREGKHGELSTYDDRGNRLSVGAIGIDGKPCSIKYGISKALMEYDDRSNLKSKFFYDESGQPALHVDGYHGWRADYDERGNQPREWFLGIDGKPCVIKGGFASIRRIYSDLGYVVDLRYFDVSGKPTIHNEGNHGWTAEYDRWGNQISSTSLGIDGNPCAINGYARVQNRYNNLGLLVESRFFDNSGNPTNSNENVHGSNLEYDDRGNNILTTYVGINGKVRNNVFGIATNKGTRDARGNLTSVRYFDRLGKPAVLEDGASGWDATYDDYGNRETEVSVGIDGQPTNCKDGISKVVRSFNSFGLVTSQRFFDKDGRSVTNVVQQQFDAIYDERGNRVSETEIGIDGKPKGTAVFAFNNIGLVASIRVYDAEGKPCTFPSSQYHEIDYEYDTRGNEILRKWVGLDGRLTNFLNSSSAVKLVHPGYAIVRSTYDSLGRKTSEREFDSDDKPIELVGDGRHGWEKEFDDYGNEIVSIIINGKNEPIVQSDGFAYHRLTFDSQRRITSDRFFGSDRQPARNDLDEYGFTNEFDESGKVARSFFLGPEGKAQANLIGVAGREYQYDSSARVIDERYIDSTGNPQPALNGVHGYQVSYFLGLQKRVLYGKDNKPAKPKGIVVVDVAASSNASKAGIAIGDVILELNGKMLKSHQELRREITKLVENDSVREYPIKFMKSGSVMEVSVPTGQLGIFTQVYYETEVASGKKR